MLGLQELIICAAFYSMQWVNTGISVALLLIIEVEYLFKVAAFTFMNL